MTCKNLAEGPSQMSVIMLGDETMLDLALLGRIGICKQAHSKDVIIKDAC
jgi:hypothetical protein